MAWVQLSDLWSCEGNKPYDVKPTFRGKLKYGNGKSYFSKNGLKILKPIMGKEYTLEEISKLLGGWINSKEWRLDSDGCLIKFEMTFTKEKSYHVITLFKVDIRHELKKWKPAKLRRIARNVAFTWVRDEKDKKDPNIIFQKGEKGVDAKRYRQFLNLFDIK